MSNTTKAPCLLTFEAVRYWETLSAVSIRRLFPRRLFGRCFNGLAARYCLARFRATKDGQWRTAARHWILNMG